MSDNIIFLMTDQHSISSLGCYGNPSRLRRPSNTVANRCRARACRWNG
jgi:hypothetical protein